MSTTHEFEIANLYVLTVLQRLPIRNAIGIYVLKRLTIGPEEVVDIGPLVG